MRTSHDILCITFAEYYVFEKSKQIYLSKCAISFGWRELLTWIVSLVFTSSFDQIHRFDPVRPLVTTLSNKSQTHTDESDILELFLCLALSYQQIVAWNMWNATGVMNHYICKCGVSGVCFWYVWIQSDEICCHQNIWSGPRIIGYTPWILRNSWNYERLQGALLVICNQFRAKIFNASCTSIARF